jgi:hypothetical protein
MSGQPFASQMGIASSSVTGADWEKGGWSTMRMLWCANWVPSRSTRVARQTFFGGD